MRGRAWTVRTSRKDRTDPTDVRFPLCGQRRGHLFFLSVRSFRGAKGCASDGAASLQMQWPGRLIANAMRMQWQLAHDKPLVAGSTPAAPAPHAGRRIGPVRPHQAAVHRKDRGLVDLTATARRPGVRLKNFAGRPNTCAGTSPVVLPVTNHYVHSTHRYCGL
jgi:hypothetical protein